MSQSDHDVRKAPFDALHSVTSAIFAQDHVQRVSAFGRRALNMVHKRASVGCAYCGSAIHADALNCSNCGAGAPPPPPAAAKTEQSMVQRVATVALWYMGGFMGLHCYAAGRPLRGLLYLIAFLGVFFTAVSLDSDGRIGGLGTVTMGIGLTLLWAFDGVQIMRGRFNRQGN